ncbi:hypothetical protein C6558_35730 [Ensifer sp. NM-2]|uniref:hypothetical protein n=1 Tax=Ensifer sp. NM-2 TaxID=2109730 RepID=UPI000D13C865|nr:hypothetical protein [Ensifer sp. NM-2]PSS59915.1 hypothetical protein C6558_35730 [Ensifer sp. NM-2]
MTAPLDIVDIHVHLWPPAWGPGGRYTKPAGGFSPEIYRKITTPHALVDEFAAAGISLAVVTATIESLFGLEGTVPLRVTGSQRLAGGPVARSSDAGRFWRRRRLCRRGRRA